ncbi:MAG: hydrogenase maturation protease [Pseudomonadota bacterium]
MFRTLVIGYGNLDHADDGVAYHVINALRRRLGQEILSEDMTGLEGLGGEIDSIFLSQLIPELMDVLSDYDQVVFVDAHVYDNVDNLYCTPVTQDYTTPTFSHNITPQMLLAFLKKLYDREPNGYLVSIRGYDFDFHCSLSVDTKALVEPAVEYIQSRLLSDIAH